jgi:hypothetical protein
VPSVQAAKDKKAFTLSPSAKPFTPWGVNYGHDDKGRLLDKVTIKQTAGDVGGG